MGMNLLDPKAVLADEAFPKDSPSRFVPTLSIDQDTGRQVEKTFGRKPFEWLYVR